MKFLYRVFLLLIFVGVCTYIGIEFKLSNSVPKTLSLTGIIMLSGAIGFYIGKYERKPNKKN